MRKYNFHRMNTNILQTLVTAMQRRLAALPQRLRPFTTEFDELPKNLMLNREDDASVAYRKAADLFEQDGNSLKEASTLRAIARIEMKNKNYDVAHDLLEKCRNLYRENGDLLGEASALSAIGCLRYIIRDIENARKALMKSVYLYGKVAHHFAEAESLLYLARVEAYDKEHGDFDRAKAHYKRSIELFGFLGNDDMKKAVLDEYYNFLNRIMAN